MISVMLMACSVIDKKSPRRGSPSKTPSNGLETANQKEIRQPDTQDRHRRLALPTTIGSCGSSYMPQSVINSDCDRNVQAFCDNVALQNPIEVINMKTNPIPLKRAVPGSGVSF